MQDHYLVRYGALFDFLACAFWVIVISLAIHWAWTRWRARARPNVWRILARAYRTGGVR